MKRFLAAPALIALMVLGLGRTGFTADAGLKPAPVEVEAKVSADSSADAGDQIKKTSDTEDIKENIDDSQL